jgi:outer membrane protein OmpA-like peptidoglycan-associated protein
MGLLSRKVALSSDFIDFDQLKEGVRNVAESNKPKFNKTAVQKVIDNKRKKGELSDDELYSFEIYFQPGQNTFSSQQYTAEFDKAIELMNIYGGAILTVEGHSDPLGYLKNKFKNNASPMILQKQKQAALNLSLSRANAVKTSLIDYAKTSNIALDESQFGTIGHGIVHPNFKLASDGDIDKSNAPKNKEAWNKMRRVKFRLIQVEAEAEVFEALDF